MTLEETTELTLRRIKMTRRTFEPLGLSNRVINPLARSLISPSDLIFLAQYHPNRLLSIKRLGIQGRDQFIEALRRHGYLKDRAA